MKSFKNFIKEIEERYNADDLTPNKHPQPKTHARALAKGEKDFVAKHKMTHTKHPVAGDHQFDGDRREIRS